MNRIDVAFDTLRAAGRKGLVGYLTVGDPDLTQSERDIRTALDAGVDILELGIPFSDPTADGPTIQAAVFRALAAGMTVRKALEMVGRLRQDYAQPIVLFGYANPFFRYGYGALCADAAGVGADGLLTVDLPFEEADELHGYAERNGLGMIPLIAPTTSRRRMTAVLAGASGFVYYIMVTGVTGARDVLVGDLRQRLSDLRSATTLPVAVGFGVSNGEQAREAAAEADAVVVGSALVRAAREGRLEALVRELATALH
jgi:tryptophan synthase alpha chain